MVRFDTAFLRSRLAWRIFLLFVICALVPIAVTSGLSWLHLRSVLRAQQQDVLQDRAKNFGLAMFQRLEEAESLVRVFRRSDATPLATLARSDEVLPFVAAAALVRADGTTEWARGEPRVLPVPAGRALEHVRAGHTWLDAQRVSGSTQVWLVSRLTPDDAPLLFVAIDPAYLLGNPADLPFQTRVAIASADRQPIYQVESPERRANAAAGTEGTLAEYSWELLLKPHFATESWIVTATAPLDLATGAAELRAVFPLMLLAIVLLVLWLSASQIRRSLVPLQQLVGATRRIASREFDARVELRSGDEFEQLADSFNTMSDSLREQFDALEALSEIDRLILGTPELESIIDRLLVLVRGVTGCTCASVTLVDRDDPAFGRVYSSDPSPSRRRAVRRVELDGTSRACEQGAMLELGTGAAVAAHLATLAAGGARFAWVQPVSASGRHVAILALGYTEAPAADHPQRRFARDFADRLAVALSNLEREERLYVQAHYDSLTRLPNRQLLKDRLATELAHAQRTGEQLAVLYVDLDNFKRVNDTLGHDAGDGLLAVVAERLNSAVKRTDTVARLGG
ncbi:MAG TPA: diguanylate cyclase, partial [Steroidobacteraceae bacterium]|nr:diguanylate cyclase [Steroidobacteraceae bacterium]